MEGEQELSVQEQYWLWRKNCKHMYEFVTETALAWPSLTVQWLPQHQETDGIIDANLLLGTHTIGDETNYLKVAKTQLPKAKGVEVTSKIKITKKFSNNAEINRARFQPQHSNIVATINGKGDVNLYDLEGDQRSSIASMNPHSDNGYGLSWNTYLEGYLATSSDDRSVVVTDISSQKSIFSSKAHSDGVNDTKFSYLDANLLGSVSEDNNVFIYDIRDSTEKPQLKFHNPESKGINTLGFSPFSHNLLATGNTNSTINVIDLRQMKPLHTMEGHTGSITCLEFSPLKDGIIASGSEDTRLILWDLFTIGEELSGADAEDGSSELFMMHAGHMGQVQDLAWCPYKDWTLASVDDNNIVHLWEVGKELLKTGEEEEKVDASILE